MRQVILSFLVLGVVGGCISVPESQSPTLIPVATVTSTSIKLSTPTLTATASALPTPISTSSKTPEPTPTWTPLPPLPYDVVENLMSNNGGCELPCWWGITPGTTTWSEARQFLERFGSLGEPNKKGNNIQTYIVFFWNPGTDDSNGAFFEVENDEINLIKIDPETSRYLFKLNQLLSRYGAPDTIYVRPSDYGFDFFLLYTSLHILAEFAFSTVQDTDNSRQVCLSRGPYLYLWSPDREWTEEQIRLNTSYGNRQPLNQIEEITEYTPQAFYAEFKGLNSQNTCLDITVPNN